MRTVKLLIAIYLAVAVPTLIIMLVADGHEFDKGQWFLLAWLLFMSWAGSAILFHNRIEENKDRKEVKN